MGATLKPESRSGKVRAYIAKHPHESIQEVAKAMGEDEPFVYQVIYKMKQKLKPIKVAKSFRDLPRLLIKKTAPKEILNVWEVGDAVVGYGSLERVWWAGGGEGGRASAAFWPASV